jgi:tripartite-type tricarboxylate transporter receptor subunit TctC
MSFSTFARRWLFASWMCLVTTQILHAQTVEEFYKGKTLTLLIPNAPGGSFDLYARLVADNLGRFIPGHPFILPQNMPGASGMMAANYLTSIAPRDGTVMSVLVPNIAVAQIIGMQAIAYDVRKFNWIGRLIATTAVFFTWHTSQIKTLADLKTRETLIAGTGPMSQAELGSTMLNGVVGTKFKIVRGYKGSGEAALAVERGEADGTLMPWEYIKSAHSDWLAGNKISLVAIYVRRPIAEHPEVPSIYDLAETPEQRGVLTLFLGSDEMGQPIAMPPGVPQDRVEAMRAALDSMVKDPEFLADAAKRKLDLRPGTAEELENIIAEAFASSPATIDIARKYYKQ